MISAPRAKVELQPALLRHLHTEVSFMSEDERGPSPFALLTVRALSRHELKKYSIANLIQAQLERQRSGGLSGNAPTCLEQEISSGVAKDIGFEPPVGGNWVPLILASGLDTKTDAAGKYSVETRLQDLITVLRAKSVCFTLGAVPLDGLTGAVAIPLQSAGSSASWTGENPGSDVSQTDSTFGQLVPSPHTLMSTSGYSRQFLVQSSLGAEQLLRSDLMSAAAAALDAACIVGSGSSNQPTGVLNVLGIQNVAIGTNGGSPAASFLCSLEQAIADASADVAQVSWVTNPVMRQRLRQIPMFTGATVPAWSADEGQDQLLGMPAMVSKVIPQTLVKGGSSDCSLILAGVFSMMTIVTWGAIAVVADQFTLKKRNLVEVTSHLMCDMALRRPQSFGVIADARNI
jgi:HK97 family phage major capsid protein